MKDLKIYIVFGSVLLLVYLVAQYNQPKVTDWTKTLYPTEKAPFGTYILRNRIHDLFPSANIQHYREPVYNTLAEHGTQRGIYLIICNDANINEYDYAQLTKFIKSGNQVFIAAKSFSRYLEKELKFRVDSEWNSASNINFVNRNLDSSDVFGADKKIGNSYFGVIDTAKTTVLAQNADKKSNFIKLNIGAGALYLNTSPFMFSNYGILSYRGDKYVSQALSYLKPDSYIIWDEYYTRGREGEESLMRVFLQHAPLRNALYIAIFSLIIFVIYEMKRRQRIIPVIEPLRNSTVEFVTVVGQVYYEQRNNANIAQKKMSYFLEHIRSRYGIKTNHLDKEFAEILTRKSGAEPQLVFELISQFNALAGQQVSDTQLILLNHNIQQFYTQSS